MKPETCDLLFPIGAIPGLEPGRDVGLMILVFGACVLLSLKAETNARRRRRRAPRARH